MLTFGKIGRRRKIVRVKMTSSTHNPSKVTNHILRKASTSQAPHKKGDLHQTLEREKGKALNWNSGHAALLCQAAAVQIRGGGGNILWKIDYRITGIILRTNYSKTRHI